MDNKLDVLIDLLNKIGSEVHRTKAESVEFSYETKIVKDIENNELLRMTIYFKRESDIDKKLVLTEEYSGVDVNENRFIINFKNQIAVHLLNCVLFAKDYKSEDTYGSAIEVFSRDSIFLHKNNNKYH